MMWGNYQAFVMRGSFSGGHAIGGWPLGLAVSLPEGRFSRRGALCAPAWGGHTGADAHLIGPWEPGAYEGWVPDTVA